MCPLLTEARQREHDHPPVVIAVDEGGGIPAQRDRDEATVGIGGDAVAVLTIPAMMAVLALPRLRVLSAALGHASSRSGCSAWVCCV